MVENCTKKRDARAKVLFCLISLDCFFDVLAAFAVVVAKAPRTLRSDDGDGNENLKK